MSGATDIAAALCGLCWIQACTLGQTGDLVGRRWDHQPVPEANGGTTDNVLDEKGPHRVLLYQMRYHSSCRLLLHISIVPLCYDMGFRDRILSGPQLDAESVAHCALRHMGWSGVDNVVRGVCTYNSQSTVLRVYLFQQKTAIPDLQSV